MGQSQRLIWRSPRPSPLEWVTPSLLRSALICPVRAAFERDPLTSPLKRTGLRAALGVVAHMTWERRADGLRFDDVWNACAQEVWSKLAVEWSPATPPAPSNWPGWALTMTRMRKSYGGTPELVSVSTPPLSPPAFQGKAMREGRSSAPYVPPLPWRERWLVDEVRHVAGKPDLVERVEGVLTVVDLKTGLRQAGVSEDQRRQLLLYADLVRAELGELPTRAEIRDAAGRQYSFPVFASDVEEVLEAAHATWLTLSAAASGDRDVLDARPSQEACSTCPFRAACRPFMETYESSWACGQAVLVEVVSVMSENGRFVVDGRMLLPASNTEQIRLIGFPFPASLVRGQVWGASDFEGTHGTGLARWNTLVAQWRA